MNKQEKMKLVKALLKELEEMIEDHLDDYENIDLHAVSVVEGALELYKELMRDGVIK